MVRASTSGPTGAFVADTSSAGLLVQGLPALSKVGSGPPISRLPQVLGCSVVGARSSTSAELDDPSQATVHRRFADRRVDQLP